MTIKHAKKGVVGYILRPPIESFRGGINVLLVHKLVHIFANNAQKIDNIWAFRCRPWAPPIFRMLCNTCGFRTHGIREDNGILKIIILHTPLTRKTITTIFRAPFLVTLECEFNSILA